MIDNSDIKYFVSDLTSMLPNIVTFKSIVLGIKPHEVNISSVKSCE